MPKKSSRARGGIDMIDNLMQDLEARLRRVNSKTKTEMSDASGDITEFVSDALAEIGNRVRKGAQNITENAADEAAGATNDTIKKIWEEVEQRPLLTLALAAGIGYLLGVIARRE